ncbi:hypothetical protein SAMN02745134_02921 [Clostridium acidisoli DSM 12555]|uniref:Uncharacterized protein n=1 Tax=Clostridium acidisoli DSM 12555 TaxID=1121291 RepID=A0A1W1XT63_9CLOT|nr:hypothetical protein [Clostridium acidisoli]SMC26741.1 hypothetical protein SAMN02745134_02921 [Clostridium acidisoli DSM 12555]
MIDSFKRKLISIFGYTNSNISIFVNIAVVLITYFTTKLLGNNVVVSILSCICAVLMLGAIIQILRKDKNIKMIISYIVGTLFSIFATIMVYQINKYSNTNNDIMLAYVIKISICVMALLFDIPGAFFIMNKNNSKRKKILILACMIYITLIAVALILFFASKDI